MLTRRRLLAGASALAAVDSTRLDAQGGYPSGPIKMLVGYPAGGGVDIVARLLGEQIQNELASRLWLKTAPALSQRSRRVRSRSRPLTAKRF